MLQAPLPKIIGRTDVDRHRPIEKMLIQKMDDNIKPASINGGLESSEKMLSKLHAVAATAADRAEMHDIIGEQRADWNKLLVNSINSITLAAAAMAGLSAVGVESSPAFKTSAAILYTAATGLLLVVSKIQPSQLAEEQRNAARLFRQLLGEIETTVAAGGPVSATDVDEAVERVLALDKAYPLPLLPGMLEKFPAKVEPTVWWPASRPTTTASANHKQAAQQQHYKDSIKQSINGAEKMGARNGWSVDLEKEMRGVAKVLKKKDVAEYMRLSKLVLKVNRALAFCGPFLTGVAAISSLLVDGSSTSSNGAALMVAMAAGAMATVVNTLEHGGQVGMVFEMYRNCGGLYHLLEEKIENSLKEEVEVREDGELFELKMALQLGRSVSELRNLNPHGDDDKTMEFAGKLF